MTTSTTTKQDKVLAVLSEGRTLSSAQMRAFFGIGNPQAVIQALRFKGIPVFLNTNKRSGVKVYRTGKAPKSVVGAGYKAIAKGLIK